MSYFKIYYDTETTGFSRSEDQILEFGYVVKNASDEVVETGEKKVRLKDGIIPSIYALSVNQINPYSKEWNEQAITESELVDFLESLGSKYSNENGKPVLIAYNGESFDKPFLKTAFHRNGKKLFSSFNPVTKDPLRTAKNLVNKKVLKTKTVQGQHGPYNSTKQVDVADALGVKYSGEAHRALTDVLVLAEIDTKLRSIAKEAKLSGKISSPDTLDPNNSYYLKTDSKSEGVKYRHVHVLHNDVENEKLYVFEEESIDGTRKAVKAIDYKTVVEEDKVDQETSARMKDAYAKFKTDYDNSLLEQIKKSEGEDSPFHEKIDNFSKVNEIYNWLENDSAGAKLAEARKSLIDQLGKEEGLSLLQRVNELFKSKGKKALFHSSFVSPEEINAEVGSAKVSVVLHPTGQYQLSVTKQLPNGKQMVERKRAYSQTEAKKFLSNSLGVKAKEIDQVIDLPKQDEFKNDKHPLVLKESFSDADKLVLSGELPAEVNEALTTAKSDAARIYPEFISYDEGTSNDFRWGHTEIEGTNSTGTRVNCLVCNRPLTADQSLTSAMGPKCRAGLRMAETSKQEIDYFIKDWQGVDEAPMIEGLVMAVKHKDMSGNIHNRLCNVIFDENDPDKVFLVDRRELYKQLSHKNVDEAIEAATFELDKSAIIATAKLKLTDDSNEELDLPVENIQGLNPGDLEKFELINELYDKIIRPEIKKDPNSVAQLKMQAHAVAHKIIMGHLPNGHLLNDKEIFAMTKCLIVYCSRDLSDLRGFIQAIKKSENSDKLYTRFTNADGKSFNFSNPYRKGYSNLGTSYPNSPEEDAFNSWDEEFEAGYNALVNMAALREKIVIHTCSPLLAAQKYREHIPKTAEIHYYLRGKYEPPFYRDADIVKCYEYLKNQGFKVFLHQKKE